MANGQSYSRTRWPTHRRKLWQSHFRRLDHLRTKRQPRDYVGYQHGRSRYLPCHVIPVASQPKASETSRERANGGGTNWMTYLLDLRMRDMRFDTLGVQCSAVHTDAGKHSVLIVQVRRCRFLMMKQMTMDPGRSKMCR